eukprot:310451-Prorocentrum_minimum.AAC.1
MPPSVSVTCALSVWSPYWARRRLVSGSPIFYIFIRYYPLESPAPAKQFSDSSPTVLRLFSDSTPESARVVRTERLIAGYCCLQFSTFPVLHVSEDLAVFQFPTTRTPIA